MPFEISFIICIKMFSDTFCFIVSFYKYHLLGLFIDKPFSGIPGLFGKPAKPDVGFDRYFNYCSVSFKHTNA